MVDDAQLASSSIVGIEILAKGTHIHLENVNLYAGHVLHRQHAFFGSIHATDRRAIAVVLIPRTRALQKSDAARFNAIGGTRDVPPGRTRCTEHTLKLQRGNDIGIATIAPLWRPLGFIQRISGRQHRCTDIQRLHNRRHIVIHCARFAGIDAKVTFRA